MRSWRWYSKVLFALLLAAFTWFVWPTAWAYSGPTGSGYQGGTLVRRNRITGAVQTRNVFRDASWHSNTPDPPKRMRLPEEILHPEEFPPEVIPPEEFAP